MRPKLTTKCKGKKIWNRLYYKGEDGTTHEGMVICYEHDLQDCKNCHKCPNHQLCEACSKDVLKHTETQKEKCLMRLGEIVRNQEGVLTAIRQIQYNECVYDTIKIDNEIVSKRECKFD